MMTLRRAAAVVPLCLLTAGCFPAVGETIPTPATPTATASASASASVSAETELQQQMRVDYEAAEKAYRASAVEADKLLEHGATKPSPAFKTVATGRYVDLIMELADQVRRAGYTETTGGTVIRGVVPGRYQEGKVTLIACEDVSQLKVYRDGRRVKGTNSTPYYVQHLTVVKTEDSTWKVSDLETTQVQTLEGQSCMAA